VVDVTHIVALAKIGGCEINCLRVISALPDFQHRVLVLGKEGPMSDRWRAAGATVDHLDLLRLNPFAFARRLRALGLAEAFQGTVLYWSNSRLFWIRRALYRRVPVLTVYLGNPYGAGKWGRWRDRVYELLDCSRKGTKLVACSQAVASSFNAAPFFRGFPIEVLFNPIDAIEPRHLYRFLASDSVIRIGMVARLDPIKDHATVIRAMPLILARFPRTILELAGDGVLKQKLAVLVEELGLTSAIRFLGSVHDVPRLLGHWDVFVYSTTSAEGMGSAVAEALMAGLPVIASDLPVMREVCGEAAAYFPAGDAPALANSVCDLIADQARRAALGSSAASRARRCFASDVIARRYLAWAKEGQPT